MDNTESLWGEEFALPKEKEKTKKIIDKISKPKEVKNTIEKQVKSKKLSLQERLEIITSEVLRVLGKQKDNVLVIKDKQSFHDYISKCIEAGRIDIDTETNNSLDPITCKLMGPCFYAPGLKQCYVPVNHRNPETKERLSWQCTEQDVKEELERVVASKILIVMHNGKFDYQVLKCTCGGIKVVPDWDTMIGAKLLDENERSAGLKQQYIDKIDPEQEKYDIEHLFKNVEYADVDPEIFALYAATDAFLTDALYCWQQKAFHRKTTLEVESTDNLLIIDTDQTYWLETPAGDVDINDLKCGDIILDSNKQSYIIYEKTLKDNKYYLYLMLN